MLPRKWEPRLLQGPPLLKLHPTEPGGCAVGSPGVGVGQKAGPEGGEVSPRQRPQVPVLPMGRAEERKGGGVGGAYKTRDIASHSPCPGHLCEGRFHLPDPPPPTGDCSVATPRGRGPQAPDPQRSPPWEKCIIQPSLPLLCFSPFLVWTGEGGRPQTCRPLGSPGTGTLCAWTGRRQREPCREPLLQGLRLCVFPPT